MSILITAVIVLSLVTAFAIGVITGEDIARDRHQFMIGILEDDDDEPDGAEEEGTGID